MENFQIIISITTFLIGLYIAFFKSYATEKGKNYATKEDIGEITSIVEEVKTQFTTESEFLKNRLGIYSQSFHSIKSLERDALIDINNKYSEWLNTLSTFSLAAYSSENFELLNEYLLLFPEKYKNFLVAEDKLMIFVNDKEVRQILSSLKNETLQLQKSLCFSLITFVSHCSTYKALLAIAPNEKIELLRQENNEKQLKINDQCCEDLVTIHNRIVKYHIDFLASLKSRIYKLIEE